MKNPQDINQLVKLLKNLQRLSEQELASIEPIIRQVMASGIPDLDYLDKIIDPLYSIVLSSGV
ncbi:MAG: hypothetical protein LBD80_00705, partial [Tannerella sp.]|nr:hypothetical protein [Tannerella sp.]